MTMYDSRTKLSFEVWQGSQSTFSGKAFNIAIPRSTRLSEAPSFGQTIFEYSPESPSSLAYRAFTKEFAMQFLSDLKI